MDSSEGSGVALVTGSGKKRIGWHVAMALAERGYRLAIHYNMSSAEAAETVDSLKKHGTEAIAVQADVSDDAAVRSLIHDIHDHFGRLDVLVNCAAIYEARKLEDVTAADVIHHFRANLLGTFLCSQHAGLLMVQQSKGGCIINFGDWAVSRPYVDYAPYFATKGAIATLTRCLAVELGLRNSHVRVNCIDPGPILFPSTMSDEERRAAVRQTLVQRQGSCQSICQAVLFCVNNDFVTGACLPVDGGRSIYAPSP